MSCSSSNTASNVNTTEVPPSVSLIILNYNGLQHLQECFTSLTKVDYPPDKLELMVVDNGSSDGSVEFVRANYPQVRIVTSKTNLGFAAGNNLGAREARSEHVVFLNNDMWVDPQFVRGIVRALYSQPGVACVGAKILNWNGSQFDFVGSSSHFAGYAYQEGLGEPFDPNKHNQIKPILFACGGAMMIDRKIFLDSGGFDEDYFIYYEDLDLGWRLWVMGYKVLFAPEAVVYHRHHGTMDSFSNHRKQVLFKRNALRTVIKNYGDENLGHVLPAALLGMVTGVVEQSARENHIDLADFHIKATSRSRSNVVHLAKSAVSSLVAIYDVAQTLPQTFEKRQHVQSLRRLPDSEVAQRIKEPFLFWPGVTPQTQYRLADTFGIQKIFEGVPRRVMVISSDILPYPGLPTVGSGLRAWGLGQGLKSCGHEVVFSMPRRALERRKEATTVPSEAGEWAWEPQTLLAIVRDAKPDVVVVCNWPVMDLLPGEYVTVPVILDQHGPHLLEREYQNFGDPDDNTRRKLSALRKADFFTCAGHKQLDYFQSWLAKAGWTEAERRERSSAILVSLDPHVPERCYDLNDGPVFVYGGVFLPWQNPIVGLSALVDVLNRRQRGRLLFFGGRHPVYPVDPGMYELVLMRIQTSPHVSTPGMVSHDELIQRYTYAHVAIDLMQRNPERELAFTTRTVEYLWCGLPVIYNDYAELSDYIRDYNAGWIVNPDDSEAITRVIEGIFDHPEQIAERGRNAQRLVHEKLSWDKTITPLDSFIRHPRMRPHTPPPLHSMLQARTARYLLREARFHYKRGGMKTLWQEGWGFVRRQFGAF